MTKSTQTKLCKLLKQFADLTAQQEKLIMQLHDLIEQDSPEKEDTKLDSIEQLLQKLLEQSPKIINIPAQPTPLPFPYQGPWCTSTEPIPCKDLPVWPEVNEFGYSRLADTPDSPVIHDAVYRSKSK